MDEGVAAGVIEWLAATALLLATFGSVLYRHEVGRSILWAWRLVHTPVPPPPAPLGRPIEQVARDVRRLGTRFRNPPPGLSFARLEGLRRAYDGVLLEGCLALDVANLLPVLPPGEERDAERRRVEHVLARCGWSLEDAA